ncbi:MAG TPA: PAS domain-containing protein, partial [Roseomonas sp.]|nr:PAS domain-containing protein [Roseomonas sp.]
MTSALLRRAEQPGGGWKGPALPEAAAILGAMPMPVVVLDAENRFVSANAAAEQFFQASAASLAQLRLSDLLPADGRIFALIAQVRHSDAPISDHDLLLESPRMARRGVTVHAAP